MSETLNSTCNSLATFFSNRMDHHCLELPHSVLSFVENICQEFCPHVELLGVISHPTKASSDNSDDKNLVVWLFYYTG